MLTGHSKSIRACLDTEKTPFSRFSWQDQTGTIVIGTDEIRPAAPAE
jgi:hypothetical protein